MSTSQNAPGEPCLVLIRTCSHLIPPHIIPPIHICVQSTHTGQCILLGHRGERDPSWSLTAWNFSSVQFSSVTQSCPTLSDPMNCSMPGLPVHHQLPEFTQTHAHRVSDAIQPSHSLLSPSAPAPSPSQHPGLFQ